MLSWRRRPRGDRLGEVTRRGGFTPPGVGEILASTVPRSRKVSPRTSKSARRPSPRRARSRSSEVKCWRSGLAAFLCRMAGRMREQMHQHGVVALRLRRLDAGGRQRKCGHENDQPRAYDAKEEMIHSNHRRCNLRVSIQRSGTESVSSILSKFRPRNWPRRGGNAGAIWGCIIGD